MNILNKISLAFVLGLVMPALTFAATVSCSPEYDTDYINKTVNWTGQIEDQTGLGDIVSEEFALEGGPNVSGSSASHSYSSNGVKHATYIVTGTEGSAEATCSVQIYDESDLPALEATCSANVGSATYEQPVRWTANVSGGLAPYTVNWGGDASGTGTKVTEEYTTSGSKVAVMESITSRYSDLPSITTPVSCAPSVEVYSNELSASVATVSCSPEYDTDYINKTVNWTGQIEDQTGLGDIVSEEFALEGGPNVSGSSASHSYSSNGVKHATYIVTGTEGSAEATCSVQIYDESDLPALEATCSANVGSATYEQPVRWTANVSGGLAPYTVNWGGDASGTGTKVTEEYTTSGSKVAVMESITSRYSDLPSITTPVSCAPSVEVYSNELSIFMDNGTTCSASDNSIRVNNSVTWNVDLKVLNGGGPYTILWHGTDGLDGSGESMNHTYTSTGEKSALIYSIMSADGQSIEKEISCGTVDVRSSGGGGGGGSSSSNDETATTTTTDVLGETDGEGDLSGLDEDTLRLLTILSGLDNTDEDRVSPEENDNLNSDGRVLGVATTSSEAIIDATSTDEVIESVLGGQTAGLFSIFYNENGVSWQNLIVFLVILIAIGGLIWFFFMWKRGEEDNK